MNKIIVTILMFFLYTYNFFAQQEAQYTQYMYNHLSINPAYAGSRDVLSITGLYRKQWVGIDGAPKTTTASAHTPVWKNIGMGINLISDQVFISRESFMSFDVSSYINVTEKAKLAFGLRIGMQLIDVNSNRAVTGFKESEPNIINVNKTSPQLGAGFFYYTNKFYLGLSVPHFLKVRYYKFDNGSNYIGKSRQHFYLFSGYVFNLSPQVKFKPTILAKGVSGAPLQVDISANALLKEKITLGVAYRWRAACSALAGFQISDRLMLGYSYDFDTSSLNGFNHGSHEVFFRYELFNKYGKILSPRFF